MTDLQYDLEASVDEAISDIAGGINRAVLVDGRMFNALGCPHLVRLNNRDRVVVPELSPDAETMRKRLYRLLMEPEIQIYGTNCLGAMLAGLNRYAGWQQLTKTEDGTRRLAYAILFCLEWRDDGEWGDTITPDMCSILNQWLLPENPWVECPSLEDVCLPLFGDAWCQLMLPALPPGLVATHTYDVRAALTSKLIFVRPCTSNEILPDLELR